MAGTGWVWGALLRGCGRCARSGGRRSGASFSSSSSSLPAASSPASPLGLSGRAHHHRRRLLVCLGAATPSRGYAGPLPALGALRASGLLRPALPRRCYSEDNFVFLEDYEDPSTKSDKDDGVYLIRAEGLPYSCTEEDVLNFFAGCKIRNGVQGIHFIYNKNGKPRGDALIELESHQDVQEALDKDRQYLGERYVKVFEIRNEDVAALMKNLNLTSTPTTNDGVVRLRGLPYSCTEEDVSEFFSGLTILDIVFVMDQKGKWRTGEAYVQFATPEMANQALLKHREEIGNRYIEIFPSGKRAIQTHKGSLQFNTMTSYSIPKQGSESDFEESRLNEALKPVAAYKNDNKNEIVKQRVEKPSDMLESGSCSSHHVVHLRGLPFQATAQDIINFFAPLKPLRIMMEYNSSGKATGEADVRFETHEDAVAAMAKNRRPMEIRYIELFLNSSPSKKKVASDEIIPEV
ncbi:G-rich sequence factor 1 [Pogona vitticeps]